MNINFTKPTCAHVLDRPSGSGEAPRDDTLPGSGKAGGGSQGSKGFEVSTRYGAASCQWFITVTKEDIDLINMQHNNISVVTKTSSPVVSNSS